MIAANVVEAKPGYDTEHTGAGSSIKPGHQDTECPRVTGCGTSLLWGSG